MPLSKDNDHDYTYNSSPVCPHCDYEICISGDELHPLYEEGEHKIECPDCQSEIKVKSIVTWYFSTDEQDEQPSPETPV